MRRGWVGALGALVGVLWWALAPASGGVRQVSREEVEAAMRQHGAYDPVATTNGARFQAETVLRLARTGRDPEDVPLFVGSEDWFRAFLEVTERTEADAPIWALLSYRHGQMMEIDSRSSHVIREAEPRPDLAVNVRIWWPDAPGRPDRYSYEDTLATPKLRVTNLRDITYRLLDFGDMVVFDEVEGVRGRPTTGVLGVLFRLIGEGSVDWSRFVVSEDGLQVARARASKGFLGVTSTVTVFPDGRTEKDLPPGRPDLEAIEARLQEGLEMEYYPYQWVAEEDPGLVGD